MFSPISLYGNKMIGNSSSQTKTDIFEPRSFLSQQDILTIKKNLGTKAFKVGFGAQVDYVLNHLTEKTTQDFLLDRIKEIKPDPVPTKLKSLFSELEKLANKLPRAQPRPLGYTPSYDGVIISYVLKDGREPSTDEDETLVDLDEERPDQPLLGGGRSKKTLAQRMKRSFSK